MKALDIKQAVRYGFTAFRSHIGFFVIAALIIEGLYYSVALALGLALDFKTGATKCYFLTDLNKFMICLAEMRAHNDLGSWILVIGGMIILLLLIIWQTYVYENIALKIRDNDRASLKDLYSFIPLLPILILTSFIVGFVVTVGFIFIALIVPGIYFFLRLFFAFFIVLDKKTDVLPSIKKSWAITEGHVWELFCLFGVMVIIVFTIIACMYGMILISQSLCKMIFLDSSVYCELIVALFTLAAINLGGNISVLIYADAYRQLNPKRWL